jgi:DNA-binding NtrC family response regulator
LAIGDATISRFHCEIIIDNGRARIRDLGSRNGTFVDDVALVDGFLRDGSRIRLGNVLLRFDLGDKNNHLRLAERAEFGELVGASARMRLCFGLLQRAAETDVTLLLDGETGTGKSVAAQAIHQNSARRKGPLVVVDCAAIPAQLLESELFGHEKGAFTGATERHRGAFEEAHGGTLFLDEIGELSLELQAKLLRALESRQIRRVGGNAVLKIDARIIAATNRDLRLEVNGGRFRSDLFYRLAVVRIQIPALRQRVEDIPLLIERMLGGRRDEGTELLRDSHHLAQLQRAPWPGNIRELRNYVDRCLFYQQAAPLTDEGLPAVDTNKPFPLARKEALEAFERAYFEKLLRENKGRIQATADAAGIGRIYLYKLMRRLHIKSPTG